MPHTTNLQQTTLKTSRQNHGNPHKWKYNYWKLKTMWQKEKLLVLSNFSFCHIVFNWCLLQTCQKASIWGKGGLSHADDRLPRRREYPYYPVCVSSVLRETGLPHTGTPHLTGEQILPPRIKTCGSGNPESIEKGPFLWVLTHSHIQQICSKRPLSAKLWKISIKERRFIK